MIQNRLKNHFWTWPQLSAQQEIIVGRELAAKGRNFYKSKLLNFRQIIMLSFTFSAIIAFMYFSLPLPLMVICTIAATLFIGSKLYSEKRCLKWVDEMIFKYAAYEAARHQSWKTSRKETSSANPSPPKPHTGELTVEQAAEGMNAALRNAKRLSNDAKYLLEGGRYSSSMAIAILALEEHGKIYVLRGIVGHKDANVLKKAWAAYNDHSQKLKHWTHRVVGALGAKTLVDFQRLLSKHAEDVKMLDFLKQDCFYTSCWGGKFIEPEKIFSKEHAEGLVNVAETIIGNTPEISKQDVELFVKHIVESIYLNGKGDVRGYAEALAKEEKLEMSPDDIEAFFANSEF